MLGSGSSGTRRFKREQKVDRRYKRTVEGDDVIQAVLVSEMCEVIIAHPRNAEQSTIHQARGMTISSRA